MSLAILADTTMHTARAAEQPVGLYISLASLAIVVCGILVKGGIMIGEMNATRREHNKRLEALEAIGITRHELDARFDAITNDVKAIAKRFDDMVKLLEKLIP